MAATNARVGYGTTIQLSDGTSPPTTIWTAVAEVVRLQNVGLKRTMIDASNLLSPGVAKEFIAGLIESQSFTAEMNYLPVGATQKDLITNATAAAASAFRPWRIVLPDFGASTATVSAVNTSTGVITTSANHNWLTAQPVTFTNAGGGLPAGITLGTVYWLRVLSATTFQIHPSPADASANTNKVVPSTSGSGTNTVNGTSNYSFSAATEMVGSPTIEPDNVLRFSVQFRPSGLIIVSP